MSNQTTVFAVKSVFLDIGYTRDTDFFNLSKDPSSIQNVIEYIATQVSKLLNTSVSSHDVVGALYNMKAKQYDEIVEKINSNEPFYKTQLTVKSSI